MFYNIGHQILADGFIEVEVDPARLVDQHLRHADVLHVGRERDLWPML
jgi:hypothetical protein